MGSIKFNSTWLLNTDSSGNKIGDYVKKIDSENVLCSVCNKTITYKNTGFQAIENHSKTKTHQKSIEAVKQCSKLVIKNNNLELGVRSKNKDVIKAEIIWTLKTVLSNYSANSCEGINSVFNVMFQNEISEKFQLSRTKVSYLITEAIGPYFTEILKTEISDCYYSILFDETTNNKSEKELQLMIKYYSKSRNEVVTQHLETFFIRDGKLR